jgi:hypothetical protein
MLAFQSAFTHDIIMGNVRTEKKNKSSSKHKASAVVKEKELMASKVKSKKIVKKAGTHDIFLFRLYL